MGSRIGTTVLGLVVITYLIASKFGARRPTVKMVVTASIGFSSAFATLFYWVFAYKVEAELYLTAFMIVLTPLLFALVYSISRNKSGGGNKQPASEDDNLPKR